MKRSYVSVFRTIVVVGLAVACVLVAVPSAGATTPTAAQGTAAWLADPLGSPAGVDPATCHVSRAHPRPVVLVPGTFVRVQQTFGALGPTLAARGVCVYGFNYGDTFLSTLSAERIGGVGDFATAATALARTIASVRARTGATKVDLVAASGGGIVARSYLASTATRVGRLVQLATPNRGSDGGGLLAVLRATGLETVLGGLEQAGHFSALALAGCAACDEQLEGSPFMTALNAHGVTSPVPTTAIVTTNSRLATPASSQGLDGTHARTVTLQKACPDDSAGDLDIGYDPVAVAYVLQGLGLAKRATPAC